MASNYPSVFISYSRVDETFADQLEAELSKAGFPTWMDRQHLEGGQDWATIIATEISRHDSVVVVLSPDAVTSTWVLEEIAFAQQQGKYIIPIIYRATRVPFGISRLQRVDFRSYFRRAFRELHDALVQHDARRRQTNQTQGYVPIQPSLPNDLIDIALPPPQPDPHIENIYMQARSAFANQDWDGAVRLLEEVVEQDSAYDHGDAQRDLDISRQYLIPAQIERLQMRANMACQGGRWGEEIGCWRAILSINGNNQDAQQRLPFAEQNQQAERIYRRAQAFLKANDLVAARHEIERLHREASYYGDPENLGKQLGIVLRPNYIEYQQQLRKNQPQIDKINQEILRLDQSIAKDRASIARTQKAMDQYGCLIRTLIFLLGPFVLLFIAGGGGGIGGFIGYLLVLFLSSFINGVDLTYLYYICFGLGIVIGAIYILVQFKNWVSPESALAEKIKKQELLRKKHAELI